MTKAEMQATIDSLARSRIEDATTIRKLHDRLFGRTAECHYCGALFDANDSAMNSHWRECSEHPARAELERLRVRVEDLELRLQAEAA